MHIYYIYHIPGVKFGCTSNLRERIARYPIATRKRIEIYETFVGVSPLAASRRERELNVQFGYPTGWSYAARRFAMRKIIVTPQPKYCDTWGDPKLYITHCKPRLTPVSKI